MRQITRSDFSFSLTKMYVGIFEEKCPRCGDVSDRLLLISLLYQQRLLDLTDGGNVGLAKLGEVKTTLRLSGLLLEDLLRGYPEMMANWSPRVAAKNVLQEAANLASAAIEDLSRTIASVEREHPELRVAFRQERSAFYGDQKNRIA